MSEETVSRLKRDHHSPTHLDTPTRCPNGNRPNGRSTSCWVLACLSATETRASFPRRCFSTSSRLAMGWVMRSWMRKTPSNPSMNPSLNPGTPPKTSLPDREDRSEWRSADALWTGRGLWTARSCWNRCLRRCERPQRWQHALNRLENSPRAW